MQLFSGNEEFFFQGSKQGVVLVHGYTGAPGEMRLLGEYLRQQGLTVLGVRLAGHGTTPQELNETKWQDWYQAVEDGVQRLREICGSVAIVGLSMGGLLTIKAAAELPVSKAAILAAPIYVCDRRAPYLPLLRFLSVT
ncbi:MAG: alpha/beta fold hydrolase [Acidaminococcaceae bacterium]|nr:alpha/beta fold hydrolase [Acidaminococcaceae bacterium]